jgi:phage FluMu protein Com
MILTHNVKCVMVAIKEGHEVRCPQCNTKLAGELSGRLSIKCRSCKVQVVAETT